MESPQNNVTLTSLNAAQFGYKAMSWKNHEYDLIPGTYVFDGKTSHAAYRLNKMLFSFNHAENRQAFDRDSRAYVDKYGLNDEQTKAVLGGDFPELLRLGANIYYLAKLAVPRGVSMQDAGAAFQGITTEEFKANLLEKGEGLNDKLTKLGGYWNG